MQHVVLALSVLSVACEALAQQSDVHGTVGGKTAVADPAKHTSEEERALRLALEFAKKRSPQLTYRPPLFKVALHDAANKVWMVQVRGAAPKGSRYSVVGFTVLVHPDGTVTEPFWSIECTW